MVNVPVCYELIQSLSKAEKIYFKRHLSYQLDKGKPTIYLKLFNELDKMAAYDVKRIEKKFKGEQFLKHLSVSFNYLYNMLLSNLVHFYTDKDDRLKATEMLGQIRILYQKKLYKACESQIKRARKFMEERELCAHLYLLGAYEFNLLTVTLKKKEVELFQRVNQDRKNNLKKLQYQIKAIDLNSKLFERVRQKELNPYANFKQELDALEDAYNQLNVDEKESTYQFKLFRLSALQRLLYIKDKPLKAFAVLQENLLVRKNLPATLYSNLNAYLITLKNYLSTAVDLWQDEALETWLPELNRIEEEEPELTSTCIMLKWRFRFWLLLIRADFEEVAHLVKAYHNLIEKEQTQWVDYYKIFMYKNLSIFYFLDNDMLKCLNWTEKVFEQKNVDDSIRKNNLPIRYLEIMAHFSLENYTLIKSLSLSTERHLKKIESHPKEFDVEKKWLRHMRKTDSYILPKQKKHFTESFVLDCPETLPVHLGLLLIACWRTAIAAENQSLQQAWKTQSALLKKQTITKFLN